MIHSVDYWYKKYLEEENKVAELEKQLKSWKEYSYLAGCEATREKLINKACKWLNSVRLDYYAEHVDEFIAYFREVMEE